MAQAFLAYQATEVLHSNAERLVKPERSPQDLHDRLNDHDYQLAYRVLKEGFYFTDEDYAALSAKTPPTALEDSYPSIRAAIEAADAALVTTPPHFRATIDELQVLMEWFTMQAMQSAGKAWASFGAPLPKPDPEVLARFEQAFGAAAKAAVAELAA